MKKYVTLIIPLLLSACQQAEQDICDQSCWQEKARQEWKQEYGEFQPNLTPEQEKYIQDWLIKHYSNTDFYNDIGE
ncbi:hypothetical protein [Volucribacter amazonae]|uniref:Lipoprotein n=1 Tax=Volucribacter amazonae TaxID=256731 RepID=A0A9X4PMD2_9PAST|nr:hypothetical protein [Volucribacter amazonae]MDG6894443.1 hypothetical protein [Volucribacter amazonae]